MRQFYTHASTRLLQEEEIDTIRIEAEKNDPLACYKMTQILLAWHPDENYAEDAYSLLLKAQNGGIADAGVANKMLDVIMAGSDNPHWYQLKGDVLFNMGKIEESEEWDEKL